MAPFNPQVLLPPPLKWWGADEEGLKTRKPFNPLVLFSITLKQEGAPPREHFTPSFLLAGESQGQQKGEGEVFPGKHFTLSFLLAGESYGHQKGGDEMPLGGISLPDFFWLGAVQTLLL